MVGWLVDGWLGKVANKSCLISVAVAWGGHGRKAHYATVSACLHTWGFRGKSPRKYSATRPFPPEHIVFKISVSS